MWEQILNLDRQATLFINGSHSLFWDGFFMTITSTVTWIPMAFLLLYILIRNNAVHRAVLVLLFAGLCVLFADQMASGICKPYFHRFRPTNDPSIMYLVDVVGDYRGGMYGFFSSHAANTFSLTVFFSLLIRRLRLTIVLIIWAVLNCWSRIYLGVHYLGDITVGVLWGSFVGACFYFLLSRIERDRSFGRLISSTYTPSGYRTDDADLLYSGFVFTFLFLFFRALFFV